MKIGWGAALAVLGVLALSSKSKTSTPVSTGPGPGPQPLDFSPSPTTPAPAGNEIFKDFSELKTPKLTGLTIVNVEPTTGYATATATNTATSTPAPAVSAPSPSIAAPKSSGGYYTIGTPKAQTGFKWYTPGGVVESREPTPEESDSGLGCPEVPDIWTYPGQSQQDLRYCSNPLCPSNQDPSKYDQTIEPGSVPPTPAVLQDQGQDSPPGKRWWCSVCRTYQG